MVVLPLSIILILLSAIHQRDQYGHQNDYNQCENANHYDSISPIDQGKN